MNNSKTTKQFKIKRQKQKQGRKTSFPIFLAIVCIIAAGILFFIYASAYKSYQIFLANRVVTAEYVDIEEGYAVGEASLAAKNYTLIYEFIDSDGTIYRKANSDRRYDSKELALSHLGETIEIRIDGKGNHMENTMTETDYSGKEWFLIAGIISVLLAIFLIVVWATVLGEKIGIFFSDAGRLIAGVKRPVRSSVLAALIVVLLVSSFSLGLSGLSGYSRIRYFDELVADNRVVEATYVRITPMHVPGRGSPGTFFVEYEYVDRENGDMVYRGEYNQFNDITNVPEMREKYVGKTIAIYIDDKGGSLPVGKEYKKTIYAYQWAGLGLGIAAIIIAILYFPVRNKKKKQKTCKENYKGFLK